MRFFRLKTSPVDFCNVFDTRAHPASCRSSLAKTTRGRFHAWSPTDARCVDVLCTPMSHALLRLQLALHAATEMARVCREPIRRSEGALRLSEGAPPRSASSIFRRKLTHMPERILCIQHAVNEPRPFANVASRKATSLRRPRCLPPQRSPYVSEKVNPRAPARTSSSLRRSLSRTLLGGAAPL